VTFGHILPADRAAYRDEIIISTKASYTMSPWPYKDGGSGKIVALLSGQIFQRMRGDDVDIFSNCSG
jgi:L-glyceraldehyde 3-phosphate reductase